MKSRVGLGKVLVAIGAVILVSLTVTHYYALRHGTLSSFDEGGWRLVLPFVGTICTAGGLFLIALSGSEKR